MSEQSLDALLQRMQGLSITRGWDAVVSMNRAKVNQLLEQQYIRQFNEDSFLKRIHGSIKLDPDGKEVLELTGLLLGKPLLSFENASLNGSKARLTMNVVSGMVAYRTPGGHIDPPRILSSYAVTEQHGFSVLMDIDMAAVNGSVDKHGEVVLDLANAYDFSSDLVSGTLAQQKVGEFFGKLFKRLPASSRVYRLGMLDFDPDDTLAPRNFQVHTQAAPGGRDANSLNYREGAVVLFVRTRYNNHDGTLPDDATFPYLIPDDLDPQTGKHRFSGSLFLSSRTVFNHFIQQAFEGQIGQNLSFNQIDGSDYLARSLVAATGSYQLEDIDMEHAGGGSAYTVSNNDSLVMRLDHTGSWAKAMSLEVTEGGLLKCTWRDSQNFSFHFTEWHMLVGDSEEDANMRFEVDLEFHLKPVVDPVTSVVTFEALPPVARSVTAEKTSGDIGLWYPFRAEFDKRLMSMLNAMVDDVQGVVLKELDLFAINHLLFPEQNALLLTHAALPGDLALFGHIDPRQTSFALEPTFVNVEAGLTQSFAILETRFGVTAGDVTWSVRGIDGSRSQGDIDQDGLFTAPPRERMEGQAVRNVVTASMIDPISGEELSASALVVVVGQAMSVVPSMATVTTQNPRNIEFKASSLAGGALKWTLIDGPGALESNGDQATYTPPEDIDVGIDSALIEIEDLSTHGTVRATVLVLKDNFSLKVAPDFHPGLPPGGALSMRVNTQVPEGLVWSVMAGDGTVDPVTGVFTAPEHISMPYSVVQATYDDGFMLFQGYGVIYQSEYAAEARWHTLAKFDLHVDSSLRLFSNGQQQVSVRIEVEPTDVDNQPMSISDAELNSIQLVDALTLEPLAQVDEEGVAEGEGWAYNQQRNAFRFHPEGPALDAPAPLAVRSRHLYVQTRARTTTNIAASLVRDDLMMFYSTDDGDGGYRLISPKPEEPPSFERDSYTFEATRISGGEDDDYNLDTLDYYILKVTHGGELIRLRDIEFEERSGMVQWESRQFEEDVVSFTAYALYGDTEMRFDPGLEEHLVKGEVKFDRDIAPGRGCPEGALLISLQRCQYWRFDLVCDQSFAKPMFVKALDEWGNTHRLTINFTSPTDRHKLVHDTV